MPLCEHACMLEGANAAMWLLKLVCVNAFAPCLHSMQRQVYPSWVATQRANACMACIHLQPYIILGPGCSASSCIILPAALFLSLEAFSNIRAFAAAPLEIAGLLCRCLHAQLVKNPAKLLST